MPEWNPHLKATIRWAPNQLPHILDEPNDLFTCSQLLKSHKVTPLPPEYQHLHKSLTPSPQVPYYLLEKYTISRVTPSPGEPHNHLKKPIHLYKSHIISLRQHHLLKIAPSPGEPHNFLKRKTISWDPRHLLESPTISSRATPSAQEPLHILKSHTNSSRSLPSLKNHTISSRVTPSPQSPCRLSDLHIVWHFLVIQIRNMCSQRSTCNTSLTNTRCKIPTRD